MDERWQEIERVYQAALGCDRSVRAAFLAETCSGDEDLRRQVESLLAQDEQAGSFLESPAIEVAAESLARKEDLRLDGTTVSHYHILKKLGGGGMGVVYEAEDTKLGRRAALKFLPQEFSQDMQRLERFQREAWAASALNHPNICTIYEIGEHEGRPFIAMELVEGETIAEKLKRGPLPIEEAREISCQIAEALDEAHEHNIIHRDLKPLNVMVTVKGRVKVLDFGLAKLVRPVEPEATTEESLAQTQAGAVMGTIPYMAPEQLRGGPVDARTDLYALGGVLYEMTTGERPFPEAQTAQLIAAVLTQPPRPPRELNSQITARLEAVTLKALAKEPERRYQSARELLTALTSQGRAGLSVLGTSEAALRRKATLVLIASIGLAILASLLFLVVPSVRRHFTTSDLVSQGLPSTKRLAVLPFSVIGGNPGDGAFSRGLAKTLAAQLTQLSSGRSLQVVPVGSLAARHVETAEEAKKAFSGVNLVLTGSFERAGDRVRISYALIDPSSHLQLSAKTLTLATSDPFAIEDQVVEGTAAMLRLPIKASDRQIIETYGTQVPSAFQDYLKGIGYLENYDKAENIDKAVDSFQSALKVDGAYTLAYAGLGQAYWLKYTTTQHTTWVDKAQESCSHAVTLDAKLPATHLCLGIVESGTGRYLEGIQQFRIVLEAEPTNYAALDGLARAQLNLNRVNEAEATYRRAISIRPNYWAPYDGLGVLYFTIGENEKAAVLFKRVIELAPGTRFGYYNLGGAYLRLGKWTEAEEMLKKSIAIYPTAAAYSNLGWLTYSKGHFDLSAGYFEKAVHLNSRNATYWGNMADAYKWSSNERAKAVPAYRQAATLTRDGLRVNPNSSALLGQLATYEAQSSNLKQAIRDMQRALSIAPKKDVQTIYNAALVYHLTGQKAKALYYLRRARKAGYPAQAIISDPEWKALKADPEFQKVIGTEKN